MTLLSTSSKARGDKPLLTHLVPTAAMPGGDVEVHGLNLGPLGHFIPTATIGDTPALITLSRPTRATIRVPDGAIPGDLLLHTGSAHSNPLPLQVAVPMAENLHPVANPAVDAEGRVYVTLSGFRGQQVPVSIFRIDQDLEMRPFVRDMLNATGLALGPDGYLYCSSRADGTIYRISETGAVFTYAEGLGIATGIAFDQDGNLFVGDRTGTIFKIPHDQNASPETGFHTHQDREIFVYATLEPSIAAYHLAFNSTGTLFVTGPTSSSNQRIHAIDRDGNATTFFQGLGRAQGLAFDEDDNLYVAASLHGQSGIVRITPDHIASMAVSGANLVGLAFLEDGNVALATRNALYQVHLDVRGLHLI